MQTTGYPTKRDAMEALLAGANYAYALEDQPNILEEELGFITHSDEITWIVWQPDSEAPPAIVGAIMEVKGLFIPMLHASEIYCDPDKIRIFRV